MAERSVRLVPDADLPAVADLVSRQMLGPRTTEIVEGWAELFRAQSSAVHGAYEGEQLVGTAQWFPTRLAIPGEPLDAAAVTGVAVLSTHRRRGHLTDLMHAELVHARAAGCSVAVLIAAEYPIYGRFGYGWATSACVTTLDTEVARFTAPPSGQAEYVDPDELRDHLEAVFLQRWAATPGAIQRTAWFWEREAGRLAYPGRPFEPEKQQAAIWRDDRGEVLGVVRYTVEDGWTANRPAGVVRAHHLYGVTPEAERELWRHLASIDWARKVQADYRPVDDLLPLWLTDARAAELVDHSDNLWLRILDLPAAFAARRRPTPGSAVLDVVDHLGFASGRWRIHLGPDGGAAEPTTDAPDVTIPVAALGAAFLGGHSVARLAAAGAVEGTPAGIARATELLATERAPWSPFDF